MALLKEVKARIASVNSTLKITSAMKMVASAKLHRAQAAIENMLPYERKLHEILEGFLSSEGAVASAYAEKHDAVERVAVVAVSSNSSLCGAFNANVARKLGETLTEYRSLGKKGFGSSYRQRNCRAVRSRLCPAGRLPVAGRASDLPGGVSTGREADENVCRARDRPCRVGL